MTSANGSQPITYTRYQQALIDQLLKEAGPGSAHRLVAPVGSGKSIGIAGAVTALVKEGRASRVLVLLPAPLRQQWTQFLEQCGEEAIMLDGRSIRIVRNEFAHGANWPAGVFTMSIDLAKREDVRELIASLPWDYVVIDEAHRLSAQSWKLIQTLLKGSSMPGVLFATAYPDVDNHEWIERIVEIDWREAVEKLLLERPDDSRRTDTLVTYPYSLTPNEVALAGRIMVTAKQLEPPKGMVLIRSAASSALSLEESLNRLVEATGSDAEDKEALVSLLDSVEELSTDSKLDCLKALVVELSQLGGRHTVLFCDYQATLNYLRSAVQDLGLANFVIHAGMTMEARTNAFARYKKDGGFLITTTAASQLLSMSFVDAVIHYDLPFSSRAFAERVGRYRRYGRSTACTAYCLVDKTQGLPIEAIQLKIARASGSVSMEADTDPNDLFLSLLA